MDVNEIEVFVKIQKKKIGGGGVGGGGRWGGGRGRVGGQSALRKHPHMFYTPSFTFLYSRKGEMRGARLKTRFCSSSGTQR